MIQQWGSLLWIWTVRRSLWNNLSRYVPCLCRFFCFQSYWPHSYGFTTLISLSAYVLLIINSSIHCTKDINCIIWLSAVRAYTCSYLKNIFFLAHQYKSSLSIKQLFLLGKAYFWKGVYICIAKYRGTSLKILLFWNWVSWLK